MILTKDIYNETEPLYAGRINLERYQEKFIFSKFYHDSKKNREDGNIKEIDVDYTAAVVATLFFNGYLDSKIANEGLKFSRDYLFNKGYEYINIDDYLTHNSDNKIFNIVIILGCQAETMLKRRVFKAFEIIKNFTDNYKVICSGKNPLENKTNPPEKTSIPCEATYIKDRLLSLYDKNKLNKDMLLKNTILEKDSPLTEKNIYNAIKTLDSSKESVNKKCQVVNIHIISSTFHLPKASDFISLFPEKIGDIKTGKMYLVGAENEDHLFLPQTKYAGHIKSMFVEVFGRLEESVRVEEIKCALQSLMNNGVVVIKNVSKDMVPKYISLLGEIIQEKNIKIDETIKKDAYRNVRMELHSDHYKADFVAWHCIQPSKLGGESTLFDMNIFFKVLESDEEKNILQKIKLKTVTSLNDDIKNQQIPILTTYQDSDKEYNDFYYVPWFITEKHTKNHKIKSLLDKLNITIHKHKKYIKLKKNDLLIVDNKRFLHGRKSFTGDDRHLHRFWIKK